MSAKRSVFRVAAVVLGVAGLVRCGGSSSTPTVTPTPTPAPTVAPTATPPPVGVCPSPTPPPLRYYSVKVHNDSGYRKVLDSRPIVQSVDGYCQKVGFGSAKFCDTRPEDDPNRAACDYMATGRAKDTGRWGPTWYYEGKFCQAGPDQQGCSNHQENQFMAIAKGTGEFVACAADDVPVDPNDGFRCGVCVLREGSTTCNQ